MGTLAKIRRLHLRECLPIKGIERRTGLARNGHSTPRPSPLHRSPLGELPRQHAPLATAFEQVQHCAEHLVQIHRSRLVFLACALQQGLDLLKLLSTDVTWVPRFPHPPIFTGSKIANRFLALFTFTGRLFVFITLIDIQVFTVIGNVVNLTQVVRLVADCLVRVHIFLSA